MTPASTSSWSTPLSMWRNHSLTIIMLAIGLSLTAVAFLVVDGRLFDLVLGFGQSTLTTAAIFFLSQFFRETAKPED